MFEKGELVYYGTAGVCKITDICTSPFGGNDGRMYYVLAPNDFDNGTLIYAPTEGGNVLLRAVITQEEAENLLASIPTLAPLNVTNEKHRREEYRNTLKGGTPFALAVLIKTIYLRRAALVNTKKRLSETDTEFDKMARRALLGELSASLGITGAEAEARFDKALDE